MLTEMTNGFNSVSHSGYVRISWVAGLKLQIDQVVLSPPPAPPPYVIMMQEAKIEKH